VVEEQDPGARGRASRLADELPGPYLGAVGRPPTVSGDPRVETPWVTTLEAAARCPWEAFLVKVLRLVPLPDPDGVLPELDSRLVGGSAHRVVEQLLGGRPAEGEDDLETVLSAPVSVIPRPSAEEVDRTVREVVAALAKRDGLRLGRYLDVVRERVAEHVAAALAVLWPNGAPLRVAGVEVQGAARVPLREGEERHVRFRADLVVQPGPVLVDLKTGGAFSTSAKASDRAARLLEHARTGERLQALAYALGAPESEGAVGRLAFVNPKVPADRATFDAPSDDEGVRAVLSEAVSTLVGAWDEGVAPPRLTDPSGEKEPRRCGHQCEVADACVRGDSGARLRLVEWMEHQSLSRDRAPATDLALRTWELPRKRGRRG
jgi:hypothetical protein